MSRDQAEVTAKKRIIRGSDEDSICSVVLMTVGFNHVSDIMPSDMIYEDDRMKWDMVKETAAVETRTSLVPDLKQPYLPFPRRQWVTHPVYMDCSCQQGKREAPYFCCPS